MPVCACALAAGAAKRAKRLGVVLPRTARRAVGMPTERVTNKTVNAYAKKDSRGSIA